MVNFIYSHSSYFDVLDICIGQMLRYSGDFVICADKQYKDYKTVLYNDKLSYSSRLIQGLEQIKDETVLYQHEDHILFGTPDWDGIEFDFKSVDADFLRLCRTGDLILGERVGGILPINNNSPDIFAVQPTAWNREKFISFLKLAGPNTIWDLEIKGSRYSSKLKGWLCFDGGEKQRGGHFDSFVFPCILTAIRKGKWNVDEYGPELSELFEKYNIDSTIRGII